MLRYSGCQAEADPAAAPEAAGAPATHPPVVDRRVHVDGLDLGGGHRSPFSEPVQANPCHFVVATPLLRSISVTMPVAGSKNFFPTTVQPPSWSIVNRPLGVGN